MKERLIERYEKLDAELNQFALSLVGKNKELALKELDNKGLDYRITREDRNLFVVTRDYVWDRVNLVIKAGVVNRIYLG